MINCCDFSNNDTKITMIIIIIICTVTIFVIKNNCFFCGQAARRTSATGDATNDKTKFLLKKIEQNFRIFLKLFFGEARTRCPLGVKNLFFEK